MTYMLVHFLQCLEGDKSQTFVKIYLFKKKEQNKKYNFFNLLTRYYRNIFDPFIFEEQSFSVSVSLTNT